MQLHHHVESGFDYRDAVVRRFPSKFSVPPRFVKQTMVVVDLSAAEAGVIEDAFIAAWYPQRGVD